MHVREACAGERPTVEQRVVEGVADAIALDTNAARRVRLRVRVNQERLALRRREGGGEVHRSGGLADPTLLIGDRDNSGHAL